MAKIAEDFGRRSPADKARGHGIAEGSPEELKCCLILAGDVGLLPETEPLPASAKACGKLLGALIRATLSRSP